MKNRKNEIIREKSSELHNLEKAINLHNLIYKYKTEGRSPKDFSVYQNPIDLFKNLRDGNINPKELSKNQINFKSDLGEIKKRNKKSGSEDQISLMQNVKKFFDLREKIIEFLEIILFFLSEAKYKIKYKKSLKILTTKQMLQSACTSKSR